MGQYQEKDMDVLEASRLPVGEGRRLIDRLEQERGLPKPKMAADRKSVV